MPLGYTISSGDEIIAVTGLGVLDILLTKKHFALPFQKVIKFKLSPLSYDFTIDALSAEMVRFKIPARFTIGPETSSDEMLKRYARLMVEDGNFSQQESSIRTKVSGIIRGELRGVASSMPIQDILADRTALKSRVSSHMNEPLHNLGLNLFNVNITELQDADGYLKVLGEAFAAHSHATAQIGIAENKMQSIIGTTEREQRALVETTRMKTEQLVFENQSRLTVVDSETQLKIRQTGFDTSSKLATIEGEMQAAIKKQHLALQLEKSRYEGRMQSLRSTELSKTVVDCERMQKAADTALYKAQSEADAMLFNTRKEAEGRYYAVCRDAEGVEKLLTAQARGVEDLMRSFGDPEVVLRYVAVEKGVFAEISRLYEEALESLKPNVSVMNVGSEEGMAALIKEIDEAEPVNRVDP